jgi:dihydroxyacetone kinase-like predicted kinase
MTMAGPCREGDALGVVGGDFAIVGQDLTATACGVVDRMLAAGGELVTLLVGAHAPDGLAQEVVAHVRATRRDVDTVVYDGGQPRYPLLIGVE